MDVICIHGLVTGNSINQKGVHLYLFVIFYCMHILHTENKYSLFEKLIQTFKSMRTLNSVIANYPMVIKAPLTMMNSKAKIFTDLAMKGKVL